VRDTTVVSDRSASTPLVERIGEWELALRRRYEMLSILNDILIAIWFIVGSVLFFSEKTTVLGTWLFLLGSIELAIRPVIRLVRYLHLGRVHAVRRHESDQDF
jgi:hypothetical protein